MEESTPADRPPPPSRRPRDLMISLAVLVVPVLLLIGGYQVLTGRNEPAPVDPEPAIAAAVRSGLPAATPTGLPEGWTPVTAVFQPAAEGTTPEGATLRVGYITPEGASVQLIQSTVPAELLLPAELAASRPPSGTVTVAGRDWQEYPARAGQRALVLLTPDLSTIVIGSAEDHELRTLAASVS